MPRANTTAEIDEARDYLLLELNARDKILHYLDEALIWAARQIVRISLEYNIAPMDFRFSANKELKNRVAEILAILREMLYNTTKDTLTFKVGDNSNKTFVPPIVDDKHYEKTLRERVALYTGRYEYEVEAIVAAALLAGEHSVAKIVQSVEDNLHTPWENPYYKEQKGKGSANRLLRDRVTYGNGKTNSAANGLSKVLAYVVIAGYIQNWFRVGKAKGAIGFRTFRNSSYPCETCDEQAMVFHYIGDEMPPFHPNCVCGIAFVYPKD